MTGFGKIRAAVHLVEGSPWDEAIISVLAARSRYRPWRVDDTEPIRPGHKLIAVLDTDPVSVLGGVGVVGADGDVQAALGGIGWMRRDGLLELGTLNMITRLHLPSRATAIYRSGEQIVQTLDAYMPQDVGARRGMTTLAQARTLLASNGRCSGCDRELDLDQPDAKEHIHIHTVASRGRCDDDGGDTDWPAVLCDACHRGMVQGGFTRFVDFRFSLAPVCPSCGARRSMSTVYGMTAGPIEEPWIAGMGCVVQPVDWVCGVCRHQWGSGRRR